MEVAALARAWCDLEDTRRELSGRPKLKPVEVVTKTKPGADRPKLRPKFRPDPAPACVQPSGREEPATPQATALDTTIIEKPQ
jgi:hypothetical protein